MRTVPWPLLWPLVSLSQAQPCCVTAAPGPLAGQVAVTAWSMAAPGGHPGAGGCWRFIPHTLQLSLLAETEPLCEGSPLWETARAMQSCSSLQGPALAALRSKASAREFAPDICV